MNDVPEQVRQALTSALPSVVEEVVRAVAAEVPGYRRPLEGRFGQGVRQGVEVALGRFLEAPTDADRDLVEDERALYTELGRGELRQGRSLDALLTAYRVGARVSFRRFADVALAAGLPGAGLVPLAEATFAYIDQLSAASTAGWAEEQGRRAGQRDRQRQELLDVLLSGSAEALVAPAAAEAVGWTLPEHVRLVAVAAEAGDDLALALGSTALVGLRGEHVVALVPADCPRLVTRLRRLPAAVSAPTRWTELPGALRLALLALALPGDPGPVLVEEHLGALVLVRDPALLHALAERRLAPLAAARVSTRPRLVETLTAWLAHRGSRRAVAEELHLHPQTVAYRLGLLRDLFGGDLDEPQVRFELEVALRGRRLLEASGDGG